MGWPALKRRPPHPQPGALPGCATSRNLSNYYSDVVRLILYRYEFFDKKDFNLLEKSLIKQNILKKLLKHANSVNHTQKEFNL